MAEKLNATFFTFKKRDRAVILPATIVIILILALLIAAFVALNWSLLNSFQSFWELAATQEQAGEEEALQFMGQMFGFMGWALLFMFPIYIAIASYEAACLRWMIRGEAPGLFGLTINNDVWRVWGVYWCWLIAHTVVTFAMGIVMLPLLFGSMGDVLRDPSPEAMMHWQLTVQLPMTALQYLPLIFLGVRFGPAAATSIVRNRFSFFEAWTVTRDRFWALFAAFGVWALVLLVGFAASFVGTIYTQFGGDWQNYFSMIFTPATDPEEVQRIFEHAFSPAGLIGFGVSMAFNALAWLLWSLASFGINARAAMVALEEGKIEYVPDET